MPFFKSPHPHNDLDRQLDYLQAERISVQWAGFMSALSAELQAQLTADEYRTLLFKMGTRFAQAHPIEGGDTVQILENNINAIWQGSRWGYAELVDAGQFLEISHHFCPLPVAAGIDNALSGGFLEGVYGVWMQAAGASPDLSVRQLPDEGQPSTMFFRFGRH